MNRHSIRFRIAVIVSLVIAISLGGFAVFLTTEIGSVNERDETAKLKSSNDMLMSMIAQTDSILREQAESCRTFSPPRWPAAFPWKAARRPSSNLTCAAQWHDPPGR